MILKSKHTKFEQKKHALGYEFHVRSQSHTKYFILILDSSFQMNHPKSSWIENEVKHHNMYVPTTTTVSTTIDFWKKEGFIPKVMFITYSYLVSTVWKNKF